MIEFILIIGLFAIARSLRRAARQPLRPTEIHLYHHFVPGPGESLPRAEQTRDNVIPLRRTG